MADSLSQAANGSCGSGGLSENGTSGHESILRPTVRYANPPGVERLGIADTDEVDLYRNYISWVSPPGPEVGSGRQAPSAGLHQKIARLRK